MSQNSVICFYIKFQHNQANDKIIFFCPGLDDYQRLITEKFTA